jgi:hypothetical protein
VNLRDLNALSAWLTARQQARDEGRDPDAIPPPVPLPERYAIDPAKLAAFEPQASAWSPRQAPPRVRRPQGMGLGEGLGVACIRSLVDPWHEYPRGCGVEEE